MSGIGRRGKYLILRFGDLTFVVHLMQGGRLRPDPKEAKRPRDGLARWHFNRPPSLLLTEAGKEKRAGVWVVEGALESHDPVKGLGPDADNISRDELATRLAASSMRLHGFLRDQQLIAGLGRRLANEICHRAKLSPFSITNKLTAGQVARLHRAIEECITESVAYERERSDMSSSKERPGAVHHRAGEPCPVCGDVVRAVEFHRYTVNSCAGCQTGGKVLADNTTSKFLR